MATESLPTSMDQLHRHQTTSQVAILDAGAQYGGLIDRVIRESGVRTDLIPIETPAEALTNYRAFVISGGPNSVYEADAPDSDPRLYFLGKPILGICYGMQLITKHLGGSVGPTNEREDGPQRIRIGVSSPLFDGLSSQQDVLMSHGDSILQAPEGFWVNQEPDKIATAIGREDKKLYGLQFHPEVHKTPNGARILQNFLFKIADLEPDFTAEDQETEAIELLRDVVGERDIMLFLSGGVDSSVLAKLVLRVFTDSSRIHAFHIDTGLMREGESDNVVKTLREHGIQVEVIRAEEIFLQAKTVIDKVETPPLHSAVDPQVKRKIIGDTFIRIRERIIRNYGLDDGVVLAQGSIRPDLIESGSHLASTKADVIKTHHNDTEEVRWLRTRGLVVEPLQGMYKDQVREMGRRLGLPAKLVEREPFPGPGLAVRILCAERPYRLANHDEIQTSLNELLKKHDFIGIKAVLLPVCTVGVQGDKRSYKYLAGLSKVSDAKPDWRQLSALANLIPRHVQNVNRVAYVFGKLHSNVMDITPTHIEPKTTAQLRQADTIVRNLIEEFNLNEKLSQTPVILVPLSFGRQGQRSIALRPFITPDFMTGDAAIPGRDVPEAFVTEAVGRILTGVPGISRVMYDLTHKPPGTTEWE